MGVLKGCLTWNTTRIWIALGISDLRKAGLPNGCFSKKNVFLASVFLCNKLSKSDGRNLKVIEFHPKFLGSRK